MVILDTNVVSEMMASQPNATVVSWLDRQAWASLWTTSITIMEVATGSQLCPLDAGGRREKGHSRV